MVWVIWGPMLVPPVVGPMFRRVWVLSLPATSIPLGLPGRGWGGGTGDPPVLVLLLLVLGLVITSGWGSWPVLYLGGVLTLASLALVLSLILTGQSVDQAG